VRNFLIFGSLLSLVLAAIAYGATTRQIVAVVSDAACVYDTNDQAVIRPKKTVPAIGSLTGQCGGSWGSGVSYSFAYKALFTGQVDAECDRQEDVHLTYASPNGNAGFLTNWNANPAGAGTNPCMMNGIVYRKYEAETTP
jgi:hypothetical protein